MNLQSKVAVVTGGGSGFGEAIAKHFAGQGATVVVADINTTEATRGSVRHWKPPADKPTRRRLMSAKTMPWRPWFRPP